MNWEPSVLGFPSPPGSAKVSSRLVSRNGSAGSALHLLSRRWPGCVFPAVKGGFSQGTLPVPLQWGKESALESPEEGLCTHSCGACLGGQGRWAGTEPHAWPSPRPRLPPTLGRWPAPISHRTLPSEWLFSPTHWRVSVSHRVPPKRFVEPPLPAVSFPEGKARLLMAPGVGLSMLLFVSERGSHVSQAGL